MKKATFLGHDRPLLCAMVQDSTPDEMICTILDSLYDGADAFGIQLCNLKAEYRTEETLRKIFSYCEGRPIYITSYRGGQSKGLSDDECMELLLLGLSAGATLCDVMGDTFHPEKDQLTYDPEAVEKQKALIAKIHEMGGEVLLSCHPGIPMNAEQVVELALFLEKRSPDIIKIVTKANDENDLDESIRAMLLLKRELKTPVAYHANGRAGMASRMINPLLGGKIAFCVDRYDEASTMEQIGLRGAAATVDYLRKIL